MDRRNVLRSLAAATALPFAAPIARVAAAKAGLCQSCNGGGNCASGTCSGGLCKPDENPCSAFRRRKFFFCQAGTPVCCKIRRGKHGRRCVAIPG